jgi:hypothetical protein
MYGTCPTIEGFHSHEPHEQFEGCSGWTPVPPNPDQSLRDRFRNVTILAGYRNGGPERIVDQWYDFLMNRGREEFIRMLEEYERSNGDPIDEPEPTEQEKAQFGLR